MRWPPRAEKDQGRVPRGIRESISVFLMVYMDFAGMKSEPEGATERGWAAAGEANLMPPLNPQGRPA